MILTSELALAAVAARPPPAATSTHPQRFTLDGCDRLERALERIRGEVRSAIRHAFPPGQVEAILLGGGYGRGEGGVLRTKTGDRPYNDLEFYVALRGSRRLNEIRHAATLRELAHDLSLLAGIEVELKILSLRELRTGPVTMFSYDLVMGHRWVYGDDRLLAGCEHHRKAARIPPAEATRLLMNRCFRTFGLRGLTSLRLFRCPRERLFNALVLLLWEPTVTSEPRLRRALQDELLTSVHTRTQLAVTYEQLWRRLR